LCIPEGVGSPRIIAFKRTSFSAGKRILDVVGSCRPKSPFFYKRFFFSNPRIEKKGKTTYAIVGFQTPAQDVSTNEEFMAFCRDAIEENAVKFLRIDNVETKEVSEEDENFA